MATVTGIQTPALAIGSGGNSPVQRNLLSLNQATTMQLAQAQADTKYDPKPGARPTQAVSVEAFCGTRMAAVGGSIAVVGLLCILYGVVQR